MLISSPDISKVELVVDIFTVATWKELMDVEAGERETDATREICTRYKSGFNILKNAFEVTDSFKDDHEL